MALTIGISRDTVNHHLSIFYKNIQKFCANFFTIICIFLFLLCLSAIIFRPIDSTINVLVINVSRGVVKTLDNNYLSIGLDSSNIADGFYGFNMEDPFLIAATKHLSPGILRVGGTLADRLIFVSDQSLMFKSSSATPTDGGSCSHENIQCKDNKPNFTMSGKEWLMLNDYAYKSGFTILFDLNCLIRYENGSWNSHNAEQLISFSDKHNLSVIWQLGNEPNSFHHVFNYSVNASQLAADFKKLRAILNKYESYKYSLLIGPDTTRPQPRNHQSELYLKQFLDNVGNVIDAVSWHQYYLNGRTATLRDFFNPNIFNLLLDQIKIVKGISYKTGKPLWLTETSSAYGGGAPGYSNSFIGTFMWLDKLGIAAREGVDLVVRQSIYKGFYALLDSSYKPYPDWWISVLYKKTVGPKVISYDFLSTDYVRLYCHCSSEKVILELGPSITIYGMNLKDYTVRVRLQGIRNNYILNKNQIVKAFILTAYNSVLSRYIKLNGEVLLLNGKNLPPLLPVTVDAEPYLTIPPFSLVFWIIPNSVFDFCS